MFKYYFGNDYSEGAHYKVMDCIMEANKGVYGGYGYDLMTKMAADEIRKVIGRDDVDIQFLSGGTQTNLVAIKAFLRPHEAVIATDMGHICVHETGSIEATGHKIIPVKTDDGKLTPEQIRDVVQEHTDEHMVLPKLVYISNSTETGLVYNKDELTKLSEVCKELNLYLFLDGARLGSALCYLKNDLTLYDISLLVDAFYIGGTKNGILYGEALVTCNQCIKPYLRHIMKQSGAVMAKTWTISVQFYALFKDGLFFELAENANTMALSLYDGLKKMNVQFLSEYKSNQIFPIFENSLIEKLSEMYQFHKWCKVDENKTAIRLVTSWATGEKACKEFLKDFEILKNNG